MTGKIIRKVVAAAVCAPALPALAFASLGSVISSFYIADNYHYWSFGVTRDRTYVYYVIQGIHPAFELHYCHPTGMPSGMIYFGAFPAGHGDADASVLGSGYFTDIYTVGGVQAITDFNLATGSAVASWAPFGNMQGYAYNTTRHIRYVGNTAGYVHRYNAVGSLLNSYPTADGILGLAATEEFAGNQGEYLIVTKVHYWYVYNAQGVEVARVEFPIVGGIGKSACGPGYPAEYGTTLWCIGLAGNYDDYVFQISLHNATGVEPASVGRIKALFR